MSFTRDRSETDPFNPILSPVRFNLASWAGTIFP